MCVIFDITLLLLIFTIDSVKVSGVSILKSGKNDLESNFVRNLVLESVFEKQLLISEIDPSIAEDVRLETVFALNIFYKFKSVFFTKFSMFSFQARINHKIWLQI